MILEEQSANMEKNVIGKLLSFSFILTISHRKFLNRRSLQHKTKFSHPEDSDYDIPDNREECPYGIRCYRKNPQHKIQFKHTNTNIASKHNKRSRKRTEIQAALETISGMEDSSVDESAEESIDESEYEPSSDIGSSEDEEMYSEENESEQEDETG